jgi:hypothetical protein
MEREAVIAEIYSFALQEQWNDNQRGIGQDLQDQQDFHNTRTAWQAQRLRRLVGPEAEPHLSRRSPDPEDAGLGTKTDYVNPVNPVQKTRC